MLRTMGLSGRFLICLLLSSTAIAVTTHGWHVLGWIFIATFTVALAKACANQPEENRLSSYNAGYCWSHHWPDDPFSEFGSSSVDDSEPIQLMPRSLFLETADDPCGIFYQDI
ncbi:hypothetical protein ABRZ04_12910 [Castellaniella ginsengisoli]|uniref:Secreted protein n=1 Tax=Castellaniella ginsengisoli TaxID=546114 RepID=A0AB39CZ57_9BURK